MVGEVRALRASFVVSPLEEGDWSREEKEG